MRYESYIMYMILQRTGLPESIFDITVKTSRALLRPQADDHLDELPLPALFGEPSDTAMPATGDTAATTSPQTPPFPAQVHHPQATTGVIGDDPPSDTAEHVFVMLINDDGTTSSTLMTPAGARAYQNKVILGQFAALCKENLQLKKDMTDLHSKVDHIQSQLSEVLKLLKSKDA